MAKRFFFNQYTSAISNACYTVEFHDTDFTGDAIEIDGYFKLWYDEGKVWQFLNAVIPSVADISVNVREIDTVFEEFLATVVTLREDQIIVKILRNDTQIWKGQLINSLLEIPDEYYTYQINLNAVCGLSRLKNITYDNYGVKYEGRATILQHVINCIAKINYQSTWVHDLPIIKISYLTWQEKNLDKPQCGLEHIDLGYDCFQEYDDFGVINSNSAWDVLFKICTQFHYRIFMAGDCFIMQHVNDLNGIYFYTYGADYELLSSNNVDLRLYFDSERTDGTFRFYPPCKKMSLIYSYKQGLGGSNILPPNYTEGSYIAIDNILGGSGEVLQVGFNIKVILDDFYAAAPGGLITLIYMRFKLKLKVGNYYLSGITTPDTNTLAWTTTESFFYFVPNIYFTQGDTTLIFVVSTNLPPAPESGNGNFGIWFDDLCLIDGTTTSTYTGSATVSLYNVSLIHLLETASEVNGQIKYSALNTTNGSSVIGSGLVEELEVTTIGDGPRAFSSGRLRVYDSFTELWKNSEDWKHDSSGAVWMDINKLRLQETISMKRNAIRAFDFAYMGFLEFWQYPQYKNERLMILGYELDPDLEQVSLTTIFYDIDRANIVLNEALDAPTSNDQGSGGSSSGSTSSSLWKRTGETVSPIHEDDSVDNWGIYKLSGYELFLEPLKSENSGKLNEILIGQGDNVSPVWVSKNTFLQDIVRCIFKQTASKTISNTSVENSLFTTGTGTRTIPADSLVVGNTIRIRLQGYISTPASTQNATFKVLFGATTLVSITGALFNSLSDAVLIVDLMATVRTIGETGTIMPAGFVHIEIRSSGYSAMIRLQTSTAITVDTSKDNDIDLTFTWQNENVGNSVTSNLAVIELL